VSCSMKWYSCPLHQENIADQQLTGLPPFYDENTNEMYRKILSDPLRFPDSMGSEARDLLTKLLNRDPAKRLGVKGAQEIRNHPFFARHIDFKRLWQKKIQPPFKPSVVSSCFWFMNIADRRHRRLILPTLMRSLLRKYRLILLLMIPTYRRLFNSNCTSFQQELKLMISEGFSWSVSPLGESVGRY
jgi:serum/glucocorticoid-regulated kinase 2